MNPGSEAHLFLLGWNFRRVEPSIRDRVAFTAEEVREALRHHLGRGILSEGAIVATCHRSEIYGLAADGEPGSVLTRFVSEWRGLNAAELASASFHREGAEAASHLFRVAGGLDSMALGESEVLGQVRQAFQIAREAGSARSVLYRLFESAVAAGKRVRAETEIGMHPLSIPAIGFELAEKVFGELPRKSVLLLGSGQTGRLFAMHAVEAGVRDLRIASRSTEHAETLAARVGGRPVRWESLEAELASADLVVGTTSSPTPVVRHAHVEAAMRQRRSRPMFFLDLATPPDIEPEVGTIYNVFAHGLGDLEEVARENRLRRGREIPRAEAILDEELDRFLLWFGNLAVVPTVTDLRRRLEALRDRELERLPPEERVRARRFADSFLARLLHAPTRRLKGEKEPARKLDRVEAIRHLFELDE
jgi:glutamyl-tRNA reductase